MSVVSERVKVLSANCQGLRNNQKRADVLRFMKESQASIVCLQDTHLLESDSQSVKQIWNECYLHGTKTNSRGVAVLFNNNFEYKLLQINKDNKGNYIQLIILCSSIKINLINVYAPNQGDPNFFKTLKVLIEQAEADYDIMCGDFNLVLNPSLDSHNYANVNNPRARTELLTLLNELDMTDAFRTFHPDRKRFTWHRKHPLKQARLDYFFISHCFSDLVTKCEIKSSYRSDHSSIEMHFALSKFRMGKGVWKMNNSLLYNKEYLEIINNAIEDEKFKYAIPIYNLEHIKEFSNIQFTIQPETILEMLFMRIRGETIKYSSLRKKEYEKKEKSLLKDIETLETMEDFCAMGSDLLEDKKQQLEILRKEKVKLQGQDYNGLMREKKQQISFVS